MYFMVIFTDDLQVVIIDAQMPVKKAFQIMYEEVSLQFLIFLFFLSFSFLFAFHSILFEIVSISDWRIESLKATF